MPIIKERRIFYWGLGYAVFVLIGFLARENMGTSGRGPGIQFWLPLAWAGIGMPGLLLMIAGIWPDSALGRPGKLLFDLYAWVYRKKK